MTTSPEMLLDGEVTEARYTPHATAPEGRAPGAGEAIPLAAWLARRDAGEALDGVGVVLAGDDDIAPLHARLHEVPFVALHFPKFTDGRCYSHARRIRAHWGFQGDILAFGDVLRDQLVYMHRCGINAFHMRGDQDVRASRTAFSLYTEYYQY
jgi:uncharacterized protein (DUF934 family)